MDQTRISISPQPRYGAFGGIYPSYENSNEMRSNLYLVHGRNQLNMIDTMFTFIFTDLRGLNGVWEQSNLRKKTCSLCRNIYEF
jgi:hypothetical protein